MNKKLLGLMFVLVFTSLIVGVSAGILIEHKNSTAEKLDIARHNYMEDSTNENLMAWMIASSDAIQELNMKSDWVKEQKRYYCNCPTAPVIYEAGCDSGHLGLCNTNQSCLDAGGYWYGGYWQGEGWDIEFIRDPTCHNEPRNPDEE